MTKLPLTKVLIGIVLGVSSVGIGAVSFIVSRNNNVANADTPVVADVSAGNSEFKDSSQYLSEENMQPLDVAENLGESQEKREPKESEPREAELQAFGNDGEQQAAQKMLNAQSSDDAYEFESELWDD